MMAERQSDRLRALILVAQEASAEDTSSVY